MPKTKTQFVCQQCGRTTARQMGRCPNCGAWNSMVEQVVAEPAKGSGRHPAAGPISVPRRLTEIESVAEARLPLNIEEFSRVLGGGIVPGSVVLVGGDPGIGKSTLLLQLAMLMAESAGPVLYVSGEESERQIKMRAARLAQQQSDGPSAPLAEDLYLVTETDLEAILQHVENVKPRLLIVDSIQTAYLQDLTSAAGSVSQVRECAARLQRVAKATGIAIFLIGHVTKEGTIAGPRVLEHIVDTVLYLEGDRYQAYRLLRSVKNRFGPTAEVGVFEMREQGMLEVANPSEAFLAERMVNAPGSAIAVTMEGTRPLLVEIQGLTTPTTFGNPRRTPNGVDFNRLLLITAVLTRRVGLKLGDQDVFVNVVGGLKVSEPAADLAIADMAFVGEIGLSGELRAVSQLSSRLREANKLGFKRVVAPKLVRQSEPWPEGMQVIQARSVREALEQALLSRE